VAAIEHAVELAQRIHGRRRARAEHEGGEFLSRECEVRRCAASASVITSTPLRSSSRRFLVGRSGNSVANHTWITHRRVRACKILIIEVVEFRSFGFDSRHSLLIFR
jgi:hypothetical protein